MERLGPTDWNISAHQVPLIMGEFILDYFAVKYNCENNFQFSAPDKNFIHTYLHLFGRKYCKWLEQAEKKSSVSAQYSYHLPK